MNLVFYKFILFFFIILKTNLCFSQESGLREIIKNQQNKINMLEDNLKSLIGKIEDKSNNNNKNILDDKLGQIKTSLDKLSIKLKNLTDFSYELEFKINRIEANLKLSSTLQSKTNNQSKVEIPNKDDKPKTKINKVGLEPKTTGVLGFVNEDKKEKSDVTKNQEKNTIKLSRQVQFKYPKSSDEHYNLAQKYLLTDLEKAEKAFQEFIILHKDDDKVVDAEYWLGRVLFKQKKYSQAALALAEFNGKYPEDKRYEQTTLLIAEATSKYAPKDVLCKILSQTENIIEKPSKKFLKKILDLKKTSSCSEE